MFTGAGSPATGGPTGEQQTGGGCSAGLPTWLASGMEIGVWTAVPAEAVAAATSRSATTPMSAAEIRFAMSAPFDYFVTVNVCDAAEPVA